MQDHTRSATGIWHNGETPVIFRRGKSLPLMVKLPPSKENPREWLKGDARRNPEWNKNYQCWEVPNSWLDQLVARILIHYGKVYLIQPHKVLEKCAPACWNARGFECNCSCMGQNHGSHSGLGWYVVAESFAFRWETRELACRLIVARQG